MNDGIKLEEYLRKNGTLTYTFKGNSMNPLLKQGRDLYTVVAKTPKRCKKNDVVLYRRSEKQYILHRVVKVRNGDYVIQGDNSVTKEYGIRDEDIIGVMTSFQHNGRNYKVTDRGYLIYVYVWNAIHPLVSIFRRTKSCINSIITRCL